MSVILNAFEGMKPHRNALTILIIPLTVAEAEAGSIVALVKQLCRSVGSSRVITVAPFADCLQFLRLRQDGDSSKEIRLLAFAYIDGAVTWMSLYPTVLHSYRIASSARQEDRFGQFMPDIMKC